MTVAASSNTLPEDNVSIHCGPKTNARYDNETPTRIGIVAGIYFYECPFQGDESSLIVKNPDGKWVVSTWYELPTLEEIFDC